MEQYDRRRYEDDEIHQRRYKNNSSSYSRFERYDCDPPTLRARQDEMKGINVTFYRAGDKPGKGVGLCITKKAIPFFDSLFTELDKHPQIRPPNGIRHIFRKDGDNYIKVRKLSDLQHNDICVVSDKKSLNSMNNHFPTVQSRRNDTIVVMNKERLTTYKLNPNTSQLFEQVLEDIGDMLKLGSYKPFQMYSVTNTNGIGKHPIDSFNSIKKYFHVLEVGSSNNTPPKFVVCKHGESPEEALPEKIRKALIKKGTIKSNDSARNSRFEDDEDVETEADGVPEPQMKHHRRQTRSRNYDNSPSPQRRVEERKMSRRSVQRYNSREISPHEETEGPTTSRRQKYNAVSKSRENIPSKQNTSRTPRQNGTYRQTRQQRKHPDDETSSESQNYQDGESSDSSDYPEPRVVERRTRQRQDSPEY